MKKKFSAFLLAALAALVLTIPALAAQGQDEGYIYDEAGLLQAGEWQELESLASQISRQYACAPYIVTVDDYEPYGSDVYSAAANIYNNSGFGIGEGRDGVLLLLSMWDRSYALYIRDGYSHSMIGDYAKSELEDSFLDHLGSDDWYGGCAAYLAACADMFEQAADGHAVSKPIGKVIVPAAAIGIAVALVVCLLLKARMRSVRKGAEADTYVTAEGLNLTERSDIYTHTTETRRQKSKSSSDESGGGGSGSSGHF